MMMMINFGGGVFINFCLLFPVVCSWSIRWRPKIDWKWISFSLSCSGGWGQWISAVLCVFKHSIELNRFVPTIVGLFALTAIMELFGHGPLFHHDLVWPNVQGCYERWHKNLMFINNYEPFIGMVNCFFFKAKWLTILFEQCNLHNWYLAADMQVHIVAFVLLLAYMRSSRWAYITSLSFIAFGSLSIIVVVAVLKMSPLLKIQIIIHPEYE